jgi:hypothetical protein
MWFHEVLEHPAIRIASDTALAFHSVEVERFMTSLLGW